MRRRPWLGNVLLLAGFLAGIALVLATLARDLAR